MKKYLQVLALLLFGGVVGFFLGTNQVNVAWRQYKPIVNIENKTPPPGVTVDLYLFWDVWERLSRSYVDKKAFDPQKMLHGAISGMVESLGDPYTVFLPPEQNKQIKQELAGNFEGIGAQLGIKDKRIVVITPLSDSPAQKAGIKTGDAILEVDGVDTNKWSLYEAVAKIRGERGTTVTLTILHEGGDKPVKISIVRETIHVKSVEGKVEKWKMENGKWKIDDACQDCSSVAYIRLSQFGDDTNSEWAITVNNVVGKIKQDPQKVRGLVLDLRNNSGGYLNGAVFIASEFIPNGTVVIQEKADGSRNNFAVNRKGLLTDIPLVVLVNKGSASASEIVAGALRDNKRVKLVGETSFGKGTIQEAQELGGGAGLHVTVAKWLTPKGEWVNSKGLEPDIKVELNQDDPTRDLQLEKAVEELLK